MQQFRFTLSHAIEGSIEVSDPAGWIESVIGFERHPDFFSLVEFYKSGFETYGSNGTENGGRDWLKNVENIYGPDALIESLVEYSEDDQPFETLFDGEVPVGKFVETLDEDHMLGIDFTQKSFWTKFLARYETPVDLQSATGLDGDSVDVITPIDLPLTSQIINVTTRYEGSENIGEYFFTDGGEMGSAGGDPGTVDEVITLWTQATTTREIAEIRDSFEVGLEFEEIEPIIDIINIVDESGPITLTWKFRFQFYFALTYNPATADSTTILFVRCDTELYYRINNGALQLLQLVGDEETVPAQTLVGGVNEFVEALLNIDTQGSTVINVSPGDRIYMYAKHDITFRYTKGDESFDTSTWISRHVTGSILDFTASGEAPFVNFAFQSIFQETEAEGFLIHDTARSILDRIISENNSLYSEFFGGALTSPAYDYPGCGYKFINVKGLQLRQYSLADKPYFMSFKEWWEGANPIFNLALEYDFVPVEAFTPWVLGPLSSWGISNTSSEPMVWTGGIATPFLTVDTGVSVGGESDWFNPTGVSFETGRTYKYAYQFTCFSDITDTVYVRIVVGDVSFNVLIEKVESTTATVSGSVITGEYEFVAPTNAARFAVVVEYPGGSNNDGIIEVNSFTDLTEAIDENKGVIVIKEKAAMFDDSTFSVVLNNVRKISRQYDKDHYFNAVKIGYNEWESEDVAGIDDPQTNKTYASLFKNIGKKLEIISDWIGASLLIEQARRALSTKTADYKHDNKTFIIAVEEDEYGFHPELSENFTSVTNLQNEETRYNKRLTPARNFLRWLNYFNSGLQNYLSSVWKFVSGEGNYDMTATMTADGCRGDFAGANLSEKQDIQVTNDYLFTPQAHTIEHYLTWEMYKAIRANRHLAIGVSQTTVDHKAFFIKDLQFSIVTGEVKIIAWPKVPFDIQVINDDINERENIGGIFDEFFGPTFP